MVAAATALGWQLLLLLLQLCKPWRPPIPTLLSQLGLGGCSTVLILEEVAESQWRQGVWMLLMGRLILVFIPFGGLHTTPCFLTTGFHLQNKDVPVSLINFNCE